MTRARTIHACDQSAMRFDWEVYNRQFDAKMNALRQSLDECAAIDDTIAQAGMNMVRDVRSLIGGAE